MAPQENDQTPASENEDKETTDSRQNYVPNEGDCSDDEDRKAYVVKYRISAAYPLEVGEVVWIVKPQYRAPLGEFRIVRAHPGDKFELVRCYDNSAYAELVEGRYLRRNID